MATVTQFNARAWRDQLQRSSTGAPKTNLFNACLAIRGDPAFRGALAFAQRFELPPPGPRPCDACAGFCLDACPVGALGKGGYDLRACHGILDTAAGEDCLGCAVRRACPVGAGRRVEAQSAFHMKAFHGRHWGCDASS